MAVSYQQDLLATLLPQWHQLLQAWSADGSLVAAAQEALLLDGEPQALKDLVTQWSAGDFSGIPPIVLLSSSDISGAMGAYAISTGTIYLNQDWLLTATEDQVNAVLTEELGHHLDGLLNAVDTPGDEGEAFSSLLVNNYTLSPDHQSTATSSDQITIMVDGNRIQAEAAAIPVIRGNSLYIISEGGSWTSTEETSIGLGGHLASINDLGENTFIYNQFRGRDSEYWIGYTDSASEGQWRWSDGNSSPFTNWYNLGPLNPTAPGNSSRDYATLYTNHPTLAANSYWGFTDNFNYGAGTLIPRGITEVQLSLATTLPTTIKEGAGEFTVNIDLSAGTTTQKHSLVQGARVWYVVSGIDSSDLETGYALQGTGVIDENGNIVVDGASSAGVRLALKNDGIAESDTLGIKFYSADPTTTTEVLADVQIGAEATQQVVESSPTIRGNSLYHLVKGPSWSQAETNAQALGGTLTEISDSNENLFIQRSSIVSNIGTDWGVWIGLTRRDGYFANGETYGDWRWTSGNLYGTGNRVVGWNENFFASGDGMGNEAVHMYTKDTVGAWNDVPLGWSSLGELDSGIAEVFLSLTTTLPTTIKEGAGEFTIDIDLSAGTTSQKHSLVQGARVWYVVSGINSGDLETGYALQGAGVIDENGNIVVDGASSAGVRLALKNDGIAESDTLGIKFYSADPTTTTEVLADVQIGEMSIATVEEQEVLPSGANYLEGCWWYWDGYVPTSYFVQRLQYDPAISPYGQDKIWFFANPENNNMLARVAVGTTHDSLMIADLSDGEWSAGLGQIIETNGILIAPSLWEDFTASLTKNSEGMPIAVTGVVLDPGLARMSDLVWSLEEFGEWDINLDGIIGPTNKPPGDLHLLSGGIAENSAAGTVIGTLSASDPDAGSSFTYALALGAGDTDNNLVEIINDKVYVKSGAVIDFESNSILDLRIQVTDNGTPALSFTKAVTVSALNVNEAPTIINLSATSFDENIAAASTVATLSNIDPDLNDTATYSLVSGTGSTDNGAFTINGTQLKINSSPDFETKNSYSIRIRTTDAGGLFFEKTFTLTVNNIPESTRYFGTGNSTISGTTGDDLYTGTNSNNTFNAGAGYDRADRSGDASNYTISGTSGAGGTALVESITTVKSGKTTTTSVALLDTLNQIESIQIFGGTSANTINAGGGTTNGITRSAFNGTFIASGGAGIDSITGGSFKNWLAGNGLAAGVTSGIETLTGTTNTTNGAMDVFDLRKDTLTGVAYLGGGSSDYARITNFNAGTDKLVLTGSASNYTFAYTQVVNQKTKAVTDAYWSVSSGGDLIAQIRGSLTNFNSGTSVLYGTGDHTTFGLGF